MRFSHSSALSLALALIVTSSASALELSRSLPASDIAQSPNTVRFLIFDGPEAIEPIEIADFGPGQYWLEEQGEQVRLSAELIQDLDPQGLWVETELDGQIKGERVVLRAVTPGITFASGNNLDMDGNTITNLEMPAAPGVGLDAANRSYVDNAIATGNAATATALAADGANCDPGYYALGVDAQGAAQECTQESPGDNLGNHTATQSLDMENNRIVDLADPTAGADAANKAYVDNADTTGNAATATAATALAADGADCPAGQYARGVDKSGAAQGCAPAPATGPGVGDMQYWNGTAWVLIPALGVDANRLSFCSGVLSWTDIGCLAIGDTGPAGGIVFYITHGGAHGLEAAPADQSKSRGAEWGCYGTNIPGADGTAVGTGAQNTTDILAGCTTSGIAAALANDYELHGYTDWFLPSKDELDLLYQQKDVVGGFASNYYWSSSEDDSDFAWYQNFDGGFQGANDKVHTLRVRAVRAF